MEIFAINGGYMGNEDARVPHVMKHPYDLLNSREVITAFAHSFSPATAKLVHHFFREKGYRSNHGIIPFCTGGLLENEMDTFLSNKEITVKPDVLVSVWERRINDRLEVLMFRPDMSAAEFTSYWSMYEGRMRPHHRPSYAVFRWNNLEAGKDTLKELLLKQDLKLSTTHLLDSAWPELHEFITHLYDPEKAARDCLGQPLRDTVR